MWGKGLLFECRMQNAELMSRLNFHRKINFTVAIYKTFKFIVFNYRIFFIFGRAVKVRKNLSDFPP